MEDLAYSIIAFADENVAKTHFSHWQAAATSNDDDVFALLSQLIPKDAEELLDRVFQDAWEHVIDQPEICQRLIKVCFPLLTKVFTGDGIETATMLAFWQNAIHLIGASARSSESAYADSCSECVTELLNNLSATDEAAISGLLEPFVLAILTTISQSGMAIIGMIQTAILPAIHNSRVWNDFLQALQEATQSLYDNVRIISPSDAHSRSVTHCGLCCLLVSCVTLLDNRTDAVVSRNFLSLALANSLVFVPEPLLLHSDEISDFTIGEKALSFTSCLEEWALSEPFDSLFHRSVVNEISSSMLSVLFFDCIVPLIRSKCSPDGSADAVAQLLPHSFDGCCFPTKVIYVTLSSLSNHFDPIVLSQTAAIMATECNATLPFLCSMRLVAACLCLPSTTAAKFNAQGVVQAISSVPRDPASLEAVVSILSEGIMVADALPLADLCSSSSVLTAAAVLDSMPVTPDSAEVSWSAAIVAFLDCLSRSHKPLTISPCITALAKLVGLHAGRHAGTDVDDLLSEPESTHSFSPGISQPLAAPDIKTQTLMSICKRKPLCIPLSLANVFASGVSDGIALALSLRCYRACSNVPDTPDTCPGSSCLTAVSLGYCILAWCHTGTNWAAHFRTMLKEIPQAAQSCKAAIEQSFERLLSCEMVEPYISPASPTHSPDRGHVYAQAFQEVVTEMIAALAAYSQGGLPQIDQILVSAIRSASHARMAPILHVCSVACKMTVVQDPATLISTARQSCGGAPSVLSLIDQLELNYQLSPLSNTTAEIPHSSASSSVPLQQAVLYTKQDNGNPSSNSVPVQYLSSVNEAQDALHDSKIAREGMCSPLAVEPMDFTLDIFDGSGAELASRCQESGHVSPMRLSPLQFDSTIFSDQIFQNPLSDARTEQLDASEVAPAFDVDSVISRALEREPRSQQASATVRADLRDTAINIPSGGRPPSNSSLDNTISKLDSQYRTQSTTHSAKSPDGGSKSRCSTPGSGGGTPRQYKKTGDKSTFLQRISSKKELRQNITDDNEDLTLMGRDKLKKQDILQHESPGNHSKNQKQGKRSGHARLESFSRAKSMIHRIRSRHRDFLGTSSHRDNNSEASSLTLESDLETLAHPDLERAQDASSNSAGLQRAEHAIIRLQKFALRVKKDSASKRAKIRSAFMLATSGTGSAAPSQSHNVPRHRSPQKDMTPVSMQELDNSLSQILSSSVLTNGAASNSAPTEQPKGTAKGRQVSQHGLESVLPPFTPSSTPGEALQAPRGESLGVKALLSMSVQQHEPIVLQPSPGNDMLQNSVLSQEMPPLKSYSPLPQQSSSPLDFSHQDPSFVEFRHPSPPNIANYVAQDRTSNSHEPNFQGTVPDAKAESLVTFAPEKSRMASTELPIPSMPPGKRLTRRATSGNSKQRLKKDVQ